MSAFRLRAFDPTDEKSAEQAEPIQAPSTPPGAPPLLTGGAVIRRYLDDLSHRAETGRVKASHYENYRAALSAAKPARNGRKRYVGLIEVIGDRPVAELIQHDLTEWLRRNPQWVSAETRRNNLAAGLACFNWAFEEGLLKCLGRSPYLKTERLKEARVERRDASDDEAVALWNGAYEELRRLIWFVDAAGARTCEAREVLWPDVQWERGVVLLQEHKMSSRQDKPEPRIVGLADEVLATLRAWHAARRPGQEHVFTTRTGRPWTKDYLCQEFADVRDQCGLASDLTAYCFRHRFGTLGILCGFSERTVGDQLGHKDSATTRRYSHTLKVDSIRQGANGIAKARSAMGEGKQIQRPAEDLPLYAGLD